MINVIVAITGASLICFSTQRGRFNETSGKIMQDAVNGKSHIDISVDGTLSLGASWL